MSLAHTSSLQKNTNQMASWATEPLRRFLFQYTTFRFFFRRRCKTQTQCEMTKGSGVFVLSPHITKWALRPSRSSKANIPFRVFGENLGLDIGKKEMPSCFEYVSIYKRYIHGRTEGESGLRMERHFYLHSLLFSSHHSQLQGRGAPQISSDDQDVVFSLTQKSIS